MFYRNLKLLFLSIISLNYFLVTASGECGLKCPLKCNLQNPAISFEKMSQGKVESQNFSCGPRIGDLAPSFVAESTQGIVHFPEDFAGKWIILFSHPADFTPVCTTEFRKLAELNNELKSLNCQLAGISVDSSYTHKIWLQSLGLWGGPQAAKSTSPQVATGTDAANTSATSSTAIETTQKSRKVDFPVIGDEGGKIARLYGMIHPNESKTQTVRSIYFIDPSRKIRALFYYPLSNGRNFQEMKRLLIAMQTSDRDHVATPAGWQPGDKTIPKENADKDIMPD